MVQKNNVHPVYLTRHVKLVIKVADNVGDAINVAKNFKIIAVRKHEQLLSYGKIMSGINKTYVN